VLIGHATDTKAADQWRRERDQCKTELGAMIVAGNFDTRGMGAPDAYAQAFDTVNLSAESSTYLARFPLPLPVASGCQADATST